jgi:hypothetical protein
MPLGHVGNAMIWETFDSNHHIYNPSIATPGKLLDILWLVIPAHVSRPHSRKKARLDEGLPDAR